MAFSASVRRLIISAPGDVPKDDLSIIHQAINRWNGVYGEHFSSIILPISWGTHAAAEFGSPPQQILNRQLVDKSDACIAIFANRLGTPTREYESGTAEEIQRLGAEGKHVGVLRSLREVNPAGIDLEQAKRLKSYLDMVERNALILSYSNDAELINHVDMILAATVSREETKKDLQLGYPAQATRGVAEVWPRVVSEDRSGRRNWYLVVSNTGNGPARNVRIKLQAVSGVNGQLWELIRSTSEDQPDVSTLAPQNETRFHIAAVLSSAPQVECTVLWEDDRGSQGNTATLQLT